MNAPVSLWSSGYGETFCRLPSKAAALRLCANVADAEREAAERRRRRTATLDRPQDTPPLTIALLPSAVVPPLTWAMDHRLNRCGERSWSLCPCELEELFRSASLRSATPERQRRPPLYSPKKRALPEEAVYWASKTVLQAARELTSDDGRHLHMESSGIDGSDAHDRRKHLQQPPRDDCCPSRLPTLTTPFAYKTLLNTDMLWPSRELSELLAEEYNRFLERAAVSDSVL